jgi:hypothetical protein
MESTSFLQDSLPKKILRYSSHCPRPLFDDSTLSAFISVQDNFPITSHERNFLEHYACAIPSNSDVLHDGAMLHDTDKALFEDDMHHEIADLLWTDTVEVVPCSTIPSTNKVLPAIWSFHHKRAPDWSIIKHKARLCPHGGKQIDGEHSWETPDPVVNWRTIRLVLILSRHNFAFQLR